MLHLFKKIYLDIDENLNTFKDRVVISKEHGYRVSSDLENSFDGKLFYFSPSLEELIGEDKTFSSFINMIDNINLKLEERNRPIIIYADNETFIKILINWLKLILKEPKVDECYNLLKSYSFKENLFSNGRFRVSHINYSLSFEQELFYSLFETVNFNKLEKENFVNKNKSFFSMEFLFASYLFDGSFSKEVKKILKVFIKKDIEKFLYEIKEILLTNLLKKSFQEKIGITKEYNLANFYDIINENVPLIEVFFKKEIWNSEGLLRPSSSETINFENLTEEDINNFTKFTEMTITPIDNLTDKNKLKLLKYVIKDLMSDDELKEIIQFEIEGISASSTFYSIDFETVNHYFIDFVFNSIKENKKENLKHYCIG